MRGPLVLLFGLNFCLYHFEEDGVFGDNEQTESPIGFGIEGIAGGGSVEDMLEADLNYLCPEKEQASLETLEMWRTIHAQQLRIPKPAIIEEEEDQKSAFAYNCAILSAHLELLDKLMHSSAGMLVPLLSNSCATLFALYFERAAEAAMGARQLQRARTLLQLGAPLRLVAMSRALFNGGTKRSKTAQALMSHRFASFLQQLRPLGPLERHWKLAKERGARVDVVSLCDTRGDNLRNAGVDVTDRNHRAYAEHWGYKYTLHREAPLTGREPQFSKLQIAIEALEANDPPDWLLWLDCDALVMNISISVQAVLETYGLVDGIDWVVAEEPNGINSGVFLVRGRNGNGLEFLKRAATSTWRFVWDQSMIFDEMIRSSHLMDGGKSGELVSEDFEWAPNIRTLPQRALNLFHEGTAQSWKAESFEYGDFILHLAGCPLIEAYCWKQFAMYASWAEQNHR